MAKVKFGLATRDGGPADETVDLGLDLKVFRRFWLWATHDDDEEPWPFRVELAMSVDGGSSSIDEVNLIRTDQAATIGTDALGRVPLQEIVRIGTGQGTWIASRGRHRILRADPQSLSADERLQRAAVTHRLASIRQENVIHAVVADLQVSAATAGRLIASARRTGLLEPNEGSG